LRLRYVKKARGRGYVWPPWWDGLPRDAHDKAILVAVRRIGNRLSLTARYSQREDVTFLDEWKPPPSIDEVEATLVAMVGHTLREVAETEIVEGRSAPSDRLGY
jgi:hypothetical protein